MEPQSRPLVGLVVPEQSDFIPPEAAAMYPALSFCARGIGLKSLSAAGYDEAIGRIGPAALLLKAQGVQAIMVIGTSLTFYRGAAFSRTLTDELSQATGLPAATMSGALIDGLKELAARRVAVVTAYASEVNDMLAGFLRESGYDVASLRTVRVANRVGEAVRISERDILDASVAAFDDAGQADGLLIVCGGLRTLDITPVIETRCGVPVVSSMPAALRKAVQLAGIRANLPAGYGRLLSGDRIPALPAIPIGVRA
jgi:arylmalonate decarboxylase